MNFAIVDFEWDRINTNHIVQKHGVQPEEAEDIFFNGPYFRVARTEDEGAKRYFALGETSEGRLLTVIFEILRKDTIRVITAYDMPKRHQTSYKSRRR
ncbi:BrnT family toxin [Methylomusa anaerophila]|nr:BrnT family toxin [Methylomusa anaerophila]